LLTDDIRKAILKQRKAGASIRAIAIEVGLSKASVHKVVATT
jgi:DNA-binding Lrp family transcriptional regulator